MESDKIKRKPGRRPWKLKKPSLRGKYIRKKKYRTYGENDEYNIPSTIYQKYLNKMNDKPQNCKESFLLQLRTRCHQKSYQNFNSNQPVECNANFMEAAKQALEDRNFRVLYDIISKALEIRDTFLAQQMHEYMEIAIFLDPKIKNKEEVMSDFVSRVKLLNQTQDEYLAEAHTLTKRSSNSNSESDSD